MFPQRRNGFRYHTDKITHIPKGMERCAINPATVPVSKAPEQITNALRGQNE